ncbi:hypothetical protein [Serratia sp. M24T3]|uniref:hypothetical protein n=1 Tax=Serratia sp. M24T3 TaxID=932213 RepID=UPI00025B9EF6|nr:hypothetical protein [Serratia sp. M24T3]EIC86098.1 group 1 glycosyl transferase [Serratia sp. M24T3]
MKTLLQPLREKVLTGQDFNESLKAAEIYGSLLHMIDIGQYDDPQIEITLTNRANDTLPAIIEPETTKDCLHIISEAFIIGGHTRLMEKLGNMHDLRPDLLITRRADAKARTRLNDVFSQVYEIAPESPLDAVVKIRDICNRYQRIVLHIHFDDIATVVACGLIKKVRPLSVYFVNHADHAFTYGSSIADFYFQLSSYGARLDLTKTIAGQTSFLGIPVADIKPESQPPVESGKPSLHFFSSGSAMKFRPFRGANMSPLINRLLTAWPEGIFTLVGINFAGNVWLWPLKLRFGKRLQILRLLPYDQFIARSREADFYVDSYPFPGGTAFAEQVLSGKRGIGLTSNVQGYSPADKLKRQSVEEVVNSIKNYDDEGAYEEILMVNGYNEVKARYLACVYAGERSSLDMENLVPWTGDTDYLKVRKSIFMPVYPLVMRYVYHHHRKLFWGIYLRFSLFNKTYFTLNTCKALVVKVVRFFKKK